MSRENELLNKIDYIDIHSHILPGVDDGARDIEETKRMLVKAYEEGIRTIIATPHNYPGEKNIDREKLIEIRDDIQRLASSIDSDFKILLGNEILYRKNIIEDIENHEALTIEGTDYVLVEFVPREKYKTIYDGLKELIEHGYYPIIAHVERVEVLMENPDKIEELASLGCYMQANAEDFNGGIFDATARKLKKLASKGLIHFLGTDAHNMKERAPIMKSVIGDIRRSLSEEQLTGLVYENAVRLINNEYI